MQYFVNSVKLCNFGQLFMGLENSSIFLFSDIIRTFFYSVLLTKDSTNQDV